MKKKFLIATLLLVLALGLSACANKTDEATEKDTFTYAIAGDPASINPVIVSDRYGHTLINMIFNRLVRINDDGSINYELADSVENAEDGLSVTVRLKEGLKWSDGESVSADDVVFSYTVKADKANGNYDDLWINDRQITVEKVDNLTVKFILPEVSVAALNEIVSAANIIPQHIYENVTDFSLNDLGVDLIGSGPYKLVEYKQGEYIQLVANENYYDGTAKIQNVVLRIISSTDTAIIALQKGEIDAAIIDPINVATLASDSAISIETYSESRVGYIGLNLRSEKLSDVLVRQALLYSINRTELNTAVYLDAANYNNAYTILPPNNAFATEDVKKYEQDVSAATQLLEQAGVSSLTLSIGYSSSNNASATQATLLQQYFKAIGVTLELNGLESSAFSAELTSDNPSYDLFINGYIMGNDPNNYAQLYTSTGSWNFFGYSNPEVDALFAQGAVELDESKRQAIYTEIQQLIAEDAVLFPIVDNKRILAISSTIGGIEDAKLVPVYTFEDVSKLYFISD